MINALYSIEVFYNRTGKIVAGNGEQPIYHTLQINAWSFSKDEAEDKVRAWFAKEKKDFKIVNLLTFKAL